MSEEETKIVANVPSSEVAVPDYLKEYEGETGTEDVVLFVKPPRLKIVQKQANDELLKQFNVGDLIVTPARELVAEEGEKFAFAPIFFWAEWCTWNPYELKDTMDTIAERTTDPNHPLVAKCRSPKLRQELWPEQFKGKDIYLRHCEHLNYAIEILSGPFASSVVIQTFLRAQHQDGTNFAQLIQMRKAPLFSMQFEAQTYFKEYSGNSWRGLRVSNPATVDKFASVAEFEARKELYHEFKKAHESEGIQVDFDDDAETVEGTATPVDETNAAF